MPMAITLDCRINGQRVTMVARHSPSVQQILPGDEIKLYISEVMNPKSMQPTGYYGLQIRSEEDYIVANTTLLTATMKIAMEYPSLITEKTFEAFDDRQGALTTITITWQNTQIYPQDVSFEIGYDAQQFKPIVDPNGFSPCFFRQSIEVTCQFLGSTIFVTNVLTVQQDKDQQMSITLTNIRLNVFKPIVTNSWTLTAKENNGLFAIDKIPDGMTIRF